MTQDNFANKTAQERTASIEGLVREIENLQDPAARAACTALLQSLMEFHASGIERMLEIVFESGNTGAQIIDRLGSDDLAGNLLLLHGLHPLDLRTRVLQALDKTRPYLRSHGGDVELIRITESGAVTLRLNGSCHSCPSSSATLQSTVEEAIYAAAPDVTSIAVEGNEQQNGAGFVPLTQIQSMKSDRAAISTADPGAD
jgi:Fe-S cluster biogenesis protein NfuA